MNILIACILVVVGIMLIPAALFLALWALVYGIAIIPALCVVFLIYRAIKGKLGLPEAIVPKNATSADITEVKTPWSVKWQGRDIPIGIFIISMTMACIITPILLVAFLVYIPFMYKIVLIGIAISLKVIKTLNKGAI